MSNSTGRRAGPVKSSGTSAAIEAAVFAELAERGVGGLSMDAVAQRAAVGKAAIYRRWPSKREMVLDLVTGVATQAELFPDTGSFEGDLRAFLRATRDHLRHPLIARIVPDLLAEGARDSGFADALHGRVGVPRRALAREMFTRAMQRRELPEDLDLELAVDLIAAPLYWRLAVTRESFADADFERLVGMTLAALRAPGSGAPS